MVALFANWRWERQMFRDATPVVVTVLLRY